MRWVNNENIDTNKCSIIKLGILQQIWLEYSFLDIRTVPNKQHDNRHIVLHTVDDMLNKHRNNKEFQAYIQSTLFSN